MENPTTPLIEYLNVEQEILKYMEICQSFNPRVDELSVFWQRNRTILPTLYNLTLVIFAIPVSSADAERSFSVSGCLLRANRAKMNPHRAHKMLFVHDNVHILEEKHLKQIESNPSSNI